MAKIAQKPAVASISLGEDGHNQVLEDAVISLMDKGFTVAVAAGNENNDACASYPSNFKRVTIKINRISSSPSSSAGGKTNNVITIPYVINCTRHHCHHNCRHLHQLNPYYTFSILSLYAFTVSQGYLFVSGYES